LNRYAYVYNNPLKYIDAGGHLPEDQLRQLLGADYDNLMDLWKENDPYFYDVIQGEELQSGDYLGASLLEGQLLFQDVGGVMEVFLHGGATSKNLWDWQGQGVYRIKKPGMTDTQADRQRDAMFDRHEFGMPNAMISPVFEYRRSNNQLSASYLGARLVTQSVGEFEASSVSGEIMKGIGLRSGLANGIEWLLGIGLLAAKPEVGVAIVGVDTLASIYTTYNKPNRYSEGWPGDLDVNPYITLERLRP
jgi:hypothetical protein